MISGHLGYAERVSIKGSADRIRDLRARAGLSQEALARKLGVSKNTVARWEKGAVPSGENASQLAEALGSSSDWILTGAAATAAEETAAPDPPFWEEFLARYEYLSEILPERLEGLRTYAGRNLKGIRAWTDLADHADKLRRLQESPTFERKRRQKN